MNRDTPLQALKAHLAALFDDGHSALDRRFAKLETHLVAVLTKAVRTAIRPLEIAMSAQSDAFKATLSEFASKISTLQSDIQAQVDAAVAAQKAKDDAQNAEDRAVADTQFKDATDALSALAASLPAHVEAVTAAASEPAPSAEPAAPALDVPATGA